MDMELSGLREYKKMFKRAFSVNMLDHPKIFENEHDPISGSDENRQIYIDDDGTVNIIKTWCTMGDFITTGHDHS